MIMSLRRRIPLVWCNLMSHQRRLAVAAAGIGFAVLLMSLQTAFHYALMDSTVELIRRLDADLILIREGRAPLSMPKRFLRRQLYQAMSVRRVRTAYPLYLHEMLWKHPVEGKEFPIRVIAFDPEDDLFLDSDVRRFQSRLKEDRTALVDLRSNSDLGISVRPQELATELNGQEVRVVGSFGLGTDFGNDGNLINPRFIGTAKYRIAFTNSERGVGVAEVVAGWQASKVQNPYRGGSDES